MKKVFDKFDGFMGRLSRGGEFLGQSALALMIVTISYDVFMRYLLKRPTTWSLEINTFLVIFITVIPAAQVLRSGKHLRISYFADRFSPPLKSFVTFVTSMLGFTFSGLMAWKGFNMAMQAYRYDERMSTALGTPLFIPYLFLPIGFSLLALQFALSAIRPLSAKKD